MVPHILLVLFAKHCSWYPCALVCCKSGGVAVSEAAASAGAISRKAPLLQHWYHTNDGCHVGGLVLRTGMAQLAMHVPVQGIDFYTTITRARFEELNMDLFRHCMEPVEKVLRVTHNHTNPC